MTYKGYAARVEYDPRDDIFVGRVLGISESISFHGETVAELHADFANAIEHYLADCAATGRVPQKAASGRLMLRVPPEVHAAAVRAATSCGKSLNQWAAEVLLQEAKGKFLKT
jgi:predicted HicB family RNase H-like nuclease